MMNDTTKVINNEIKVQPEGFDLTKFAAIPQNNGIALEKRIVIVPVRKPDKQKFFKCSNAHEPYLANVVEIKEDSEYYLVSNDIQQVIPGETKLVKLYVCYYMNGTIFLCPVPQPDENGKWNSWHKSLSEIVVQAREQWIRALPDKSVGGYNAMAAQGAFREPNMKMLPMGEYLRIAFKDRIIESEEHAVIRQLMGIE